MRNFEGEQTQKVTGFFMGGKRKGKRRDPSTEHGSHTDGSFPAAWMSFQGHMV